jgi:7-carboxy-7-deazaguanine synthase
MFGQNKVRNPHAFDTMPSNALKVTSIFPTLQGEGPFAGRPAVFIRLAYCNLKCDFCDTWFDSGDNMTFAEIDQAIEEACKRYPQWRTYKPMLVFTGGEPLMQPNLSEYLLHRSTREHPFHRENQLVQIETNGNFAAPNLPWWVHVVISPKVNEKTGQYIKVDKDLLARADALKFVISRFMSAYNMVPTWALDWRGVANRPIYLSPMNCYARQPRLPSPDDSAAVRAERERISFWEPGLLDMEKNRQNHEYTAALAMGLGCYLSIQQHLYAGLP